MQVQLDRLSLVIENAPDACLPARLYLFLYPLRQHVGHSLAKDASEAAAAASARLEQGQVHLLRAHLHVLRDRCHGHIGNVVQNRRGNRHTVERK